MQSARSNGSLSKPNKFAAIAVSHASSAVTEDSKNDVRKKRSRPNSNNSNELRRLCEEPKTIEPKPTSRNPREDPTPNPPCQDLTKRNFTDPKPNSLKNSHKSNVDWQKRA